MFVRQRKSSSVIVSCFAKQRSGRFALVDRDPGDAQIVIAADGPYLVSGGLSLSEQSLSVDQQGNTWDFTDLGSIDAPERYALCRCGQSANKPFCDGSHGRIGFDGTEVASRQPFGDDAETLEGPTMDLIDNRPLCAFARICDGHGRIWNTVHKTDEPDMRQIVTHQGTSCPSGRLVVRDKLAGSTLEPDLPRSIVLLEDPQENASGPIWVRGGVSVVSADGIPYEQRNRVTLCRCGQSSNKPFCDGTHAHIGFRAHPAESDASGA
jgi:CDGSH-type Zn-finger protein